MKQLSRHEFAVTRVGFDFFQQGCLAVKFALLGVPCTRQVHQVSNFLHALFAKKQGQYLLAIFTQVTEVVPENTFLFGNNDGLDQIGIIRIFEIIDKGYL